MMYMSIDEAIDHLIRYGYATTRRRAHRMVMERIKTGEIAATGINSITGDRETISKECLPFIDIDAYAPQEH